MGATVRTSCSRCGDVELPVAEATVRIPGAGAATIVEFACPQCGSPQGQPLTERGTMLLLRSGVGVKADAAPLGSERLPSSSDGGR